MPMQEVPLLREAGESHLSLTSCSYEVKEVHLWLILHQFVP